jgi:hypothetical protein
MMAMDACFRRAGSTGSTAAKDGRRHGAGAGLRPFMGASGDGAGNDRLSVSSFMFITEYKAEVGQWLSKLNYFPTQIGGSFCTRFPAGEGQETKLERSKYYNTTRLRPNVSRL